MTLSTSNLVLSNTAGMIALGVVGVDGVTVTPVGPSNPVPTTGGGSSRLADNLVVDAAGIYWILQDQGGGTFVYYKLSTLAVGTPTAPVVPAATSTGLQVVEQSYDVITSAAGYAVGDILLHIAVLNITVIPPTITTSAWINITQGTVLGTAPLAANIVLTPTTQAVTAADGGLTTIGAKADAAYAGGGGSASAIALYKGIYNLLAGTLTATLGAGSNIIGTVGVTGTVNVAQSGTWTTGRSWNLASGTDSVAIGGTLPAFAATPTFNLGTLNGAATSTLQTSIITTLGSPMQQTGGSVGLAAGSNIIGSILGRTGNVSVTPTVTASTYTAGFVIGGIMTFTNIFGSAGSGILQSVAAVFSGSVQTAEIDLYIFKASPSNGTYTDHAAPTWSAADAANLIGVVPLTLAKSGLGTMTVYTLAGEALALKPGGTNLYVVAVAAGALVTLGSTSGFTLTMTALQD